MFAQDRDLLALEPNLFKDIAWTGQRLIACTGSVSGTTLTITPGDTDFTTAGIMPGHIVLVDGIPYEIVQVLTSTAATISILRADPAGPILPPAATVSAPETIPSPAPQIAIAHAQLLRLLDIEPGDPNASPSESSITNPGALVLVECLAALHLILTAAAALATPGSTLWIRAAHYRERIAHERPRVAALIDLDGDGRPDATRRLSTFALLRA
jgi:hypothetical protein